MSQQADCIFCKIATGEIPASTVWASDDAVAFLDVSPLAEGHTLLIPRRHYTDLRDVPSDEIGPILSAAPALTSAIMKATGATGVNVLQNTGAAAGQAVFHVHFHFVPRIEGDNLGYRWNAGKYAAGRAEEMLDAIQASLG